MKFIIFNIKANSPNVVENMREAPDDEGFTGRWHQVDVEIPILPAFSIVYFLKSSKFSEAEL